MGLTFLKSFSIIPEHSHEKGVSREEVRILTELREQHFDTEPRNTRVGCKKG